MVIKVKLLWKIVFIIFIISGIILAPNKFQSSNDITFIDIVYVLLIPFGVIGFLFMLPTLKETFSEEGIEVYWKIGIGPLILWERKNYKLLWHQVTGVHSFLWTWFPIQLFIFSGISGNKSRGFTIGSLTTHKKKALLYLADHVNPNVMDKDVQKLVDKYRKQSK